MSHVFLNLSFHSLSVSGMKIKKRQYWFFYLEKKLVIIALAILLSYLSYYPNAQKVAGPCLSLILQLRFGEGRG